jgi:hypothetical protein
MVHSRDLEQALDSLFTKFQKPCQVFFNQLFLAISFHLTEKETVGWQLGGLSRRDNEVNEGLKQDLERIRYEPRMMEYARVIGMVFVFGIR